MCANGVQRDGQLLCDLIPGQVRREVFQAYYPNLDEAAAALDWEPDSYCRRISPVQNAAADSERQNDMATFNDTVIENYRANDGVLGGHWEGKTILLLHTPGRKSGKQLVNPLVAAPYGDSHIVCGSGGGAPQDPQWVANLEAVDGPVTIELGADTAQADHRVVRPGRDDDWDRLYGVWRAYWPDAATYEKNTDRKFPVAVITVWRTQ